MLTDSVRCLYLLVYEGSSLRSTEDTQDIILELWLSFFDLRVISQAFDALLLEK